MNPDLTSAVIEFLKALTKVLNNVNELIEEELKED